MKLCLLEREAICYAYRVHYTPMIELAQRYSITRMAVYNVLRKAGVDTSKKAAAITTICDNPDCQKTIIKFRCVIRKHQHSFCNRKCYGNWKSITNNQVLQQQLKEMTEKAKKENPCNFKNSQAQPLSSTPSTSSPINP